MSELTRAQESRGAIERMYIVMRHLFIRGYYKPNGVSGQAIQDELLTLRPEIYGSIDDLRKVELNGLAYVIDRLPKGIEECRFIKLISEEGYESSSFKRLVPAARRRNCYRIDQEQMFIEVTRGRSEIYDILTHLTFLYIEAQKIKAHALDEKGNPLREWEKLEEIVTGKVPITKKNEEVAYTYLATILGRTYEETKETHLRFIKNSETNNGLFHIVYWLGKVSIDEEQGKDMEISFSPTLRTRIGHHIYGERWSDRIKKYLYDNHLIERPIHIISSNLHSVMNSLYAYAALSKSAKTNDMIALMEEVSNANNGHLREKIAQYAQEHGLHLIKESTGTNISTQIIDTQKIDWNKVPKSISFNKEHLEKEKPVLFVMDYAFGEQAYETMDELLKPFVNEEGLKIHMNIASISVMGKAGILTGDKGDIMLPTAHIFEGTADNYPFENDLEIEDFDKHGVPTFKGPMISVLGTSLQNKKILEYFKESSWNAVGLEMEGAHYQKAIQGASQIRKSIRRDVKIRYAYYASDNPLHTGSTLASGSLGLTGVKPTYLITKKFLEKILL